MTCHMMWGHRPRFWEKGCYNLSFELSERHTLILSNTRELNRVPKYKLSTLYMKYCWSMLYFFSLTLITMCSPCYIISLSLEPSILFYCIMWACDCDWCDHLVMPMWHVTSCFVFFAYVQIKKKKKKLKIK